MPVAGHAHSAHVSDVVSGTREKHSEARNHVPYRNSKLTHLLSEALGAKDARTMVLCTLNPLHDNASESLSTLRFAERLAAVSKAEGPAAPAKGK